MAETPSSSHAVPHVDAAGGGGGAGAGAGCGAAQPRRATWQQKAFFAEGQACSKLGYPALQSKGLHLASAKLHAEHTGHSCTTKSWPSLQGVVSLANPWPAAHWMRSLHVCDWPAWSHTVSHPAAGGAPLVDASDVEVTGGGAAEVDAQARPWWWQHHSFFPDDHPACQFANPAAQS